MDLQQITGNCDAVYSAAGVTTRAAALRTCQALVWCGLQLVLRVHLYRSLHTLYYGNTLGMQLHDGVGLYQERPGEEPARASWCLKQGRILMYGYT